MNRLGEIIAILLKEEGLRARLGEGARRFASREFPTWEQRGELEISLAEEVVGRPTQA